MNKFVQYQKAKTLLTPFNIKTSTEWKEKKDKVREMYPKIPARPDVYYSKLGDWKGWKEFLKNDVHTIVRVAKKQYTYQEAKEVLKLYNLHTSGEWQLNCKNIRKKYKNLPCSPSVYYRQTGEWVSWKDFLGYVKPIDITSKRSKRMSYQEASSLVVELGIKTIGDFKRNNVAIRSKYPTFPIDPKVYPEFKDWYSFLQIEPLRCLTYQEAKEILKPLNLKTGTLFYQHIHQIIKIMGKQPYKFPTKRPDVYYKQTGEWISWADFLSRPEGESVRKRRSKDFEKELYALEILRKVNHPSCEKQIEILEKKLLIKH